MCVCATVAKRAAQTSCRNGWCVQKLARSSRLAKVCHLRISTGTAASGVQVGSLQCRLPATSPASAMLVRCCRRGRP
jgi:hypothetical protein